MNKRRFKTMSESFQLLCLLHCVLEALREAQEDQLNWRTDIFGVAAQYGKGQGIKRADFDLIRSLTIDQIINKSLEENLIGLEVVNPRVKKGPNRIGKVLSPLKHINNVNSFMIGFRDFEENWTYEYVLNNLKKRNLARTLSV